MDVQYARQYHVFESSFPRFQSAIHRRTEDRAARRSILDNL
jgi:pyrroloquinoline quinone (PQQ) biosynthesis protein C